MSAAPKNIDPINLSSPQQAAKNRSGIVIKEKLNNDQSSVEPADDVILPTQRNSNDSKDALKNDQSHVESSIDESILNSEIYQIYCQAEDTYRAAQQIKEHKNCVLFEREPRPFEIPEEEFRRMCKSTLTNLWKHGPGETKFDRLKKFINGTIKHEVLGRNDHGISMHGVFLSHMTKIKILNPDGYEYFYVVNFKMGHPRDCESRNGNNIFTKWYRAESYESGKAQRLAQLKVLGITDSILDQLQFNHYLTKNSTNIKWLDFAQGILSGNQDDDCLVRGGPFGGREGMFNLIVKGFDSKLSLYSQEIFRL